MKLTKVITTKEFLGIPQGSEGVIITPRDEIGDYPPSVEIKFDCKDRPVLLQYPFESHYYVVTPWIGGDMTCTCEDWAENVPKVDVGFTLLYAHGLGSYTGKQFKYCPWCGKELIEEKQS